MTIVERQVKPRGSATGRGGKKKQRRKPQQDRLPGRREMDRHREPLVDERKADVINRLKSARRHLDQVTASLDDSPAVVDVLREIAVVRSSLDATVRVALRYYFEHGFVNAARAGEIEPSIDEMMGALTFLKQID
jgi:DNA-binding FrmR family transcriptional regulator